ncbi:hypothetical protein H4R35_002321 [Dimargaris xerosporica]|nr:hypothetical protein H4R35_002321 [Dimargaris xerosporica]
MYAASTAVLLLLLGLQAPALPTQNLAGTNPFADSSQRTSVSSTELQGQNALELQTLTLGDVCQTIQASVDQGQGNFGSEFTALQFPPQVYTRQGQSDINNDNGPACPLEPNLVFFQEHCQGPQRRNDEVAIRVEQLPRTSEDSELTAVETHYVPGESYGPGSYDTGLTSLAPAERPQQPNGMLRKIRNRFTPERQFQCMLFVVGSATVGGILGYVLWPTTHGGHY